VNDLTTTTYVVEGGEIGAQNYTMYVVAGASIR